MESHRILIIEDHEPTRNALRALLVRAGHEVATAGTLSEGLTLLGFGPIPDCVVLDLDLPDGRGEAVLRAIRDSEMAVRVAVCSGVDDPSRWEDMSNLGAQALMAKPVGPADVSRICP